MAISQVALSTLPRDPSNSDLNTAIQSINDILAAPTLGSVTTVPVTVTGNVTLSAADHSGRSVYLNKAAGIAVTLPAATGSGARYRLILAATVTSNTTTVTAASGDYINGVIRGGTGSSGSADSWPTTAATNTTITLDGTTKGGYIGDVIELEDMATNEWAISGQIKQSGTVATPIS